MPAIKYSVKKKSKRENCFFKNWRSLERPRQCYAKKTTKGLSLFQQPHYTIYIIVAAILRLQCSLVIISIG